MRPVKETVLSGRSASDAALAVAASTRTGRTVSPWQIERWRQWGLIEPPIREWRGRQGSRSVYSERSLDQASAVAELARRRRPLHEVALILFVRGVPIPESAVRRAYASLFDHIADWLGDVATASDPDLHSAGIKAQGLVRFSLRSRQGRRMLKRLQHAEEPAESLLTSVWQNVFSVLQTGEFLSEGGFEELLRAGGLTGAGTDRIPGGPGPLAPDFPDGIAEVLQRMRLTELRLRVESATIDELTAALDDYRSFVSMARSVAVIASVLWNLPSAFGFGALADIVEDDLATAQQLAVILLLAPELATPSGQQVMELIRASAPSFAQAADFLAGLPRSVQKALGRQDPAALDALPPEERERVRAAARAIHLDTTTAQAALAGQTSAVDGLPPVRDPPLLSPAGAVPDFGAGTVIARDTSVGPADLLERSIPYQRSGYSRRDRRT